MAQNEYGVGQNDLGFSQNFMQKIQMNFQASSVVALFLKYHQVPRNTPGTQQVLSQHVLREFMSKLENKKLSSGPHITKQREN